ncbi:MAG: AraC family transcriptional regulator [Cyclobacteriaceae bacterium]|nr:AraC family transcriptional regulator [Cyclobacteriaceae bacterium]
MHYQKFMPCDRLRSFVECYFVWEGLAKEELDIQSPPNSFGAIVINYSDPYYAYQNNALRMAVPKAFACGLFTSNYHLVLKGTIGMVGVVLKATSLHNFFGLRMSELVNNRMALEYILKDKAGSLVSAVEAAHTDEAKVKILEEFVLSRLPDAKSRLSVIDEAVELIDQNQGCIAVQIVAEQLKISKRYLEKKFLEKVGFSPKFYARIKRFTALSKEVAYNKKLNWQDLVLKYGLHDQSHLVKEFMEFNQMNPTDYLTNHQELVRFMKR